MFQQIHAHIKRTTMGIAGIGCIFARSTVLHVCSSSGNYRFCSVVGYAGSHAFINPYTYDYSASATNALIAVFQI